MSGRFQPLYDETAPAIVPPPEPNALAPPPTWADAATLAGEEIARQRAISAQRGLWNEQGITPAGTRDAAMQLVNMLASTSTAPALRAPVAPKLNPDAVGFSDRISTRQPSRATDAHDTADYTVDLDAYHSAPNQYGARAQDIIERHPGVVDKTPEGFVTHIVDNLRELWGAVPDDWKQGAMRWYNGARTLAETQAEKYGTSVRAQAANLAAQSPQRQWEHNVELSDRVANIHANHGDTPWSAAHDEAWLHPETGFGVTNPDWAPAFEAIRGKTLNEITDPNTAALWIRLHDRATAEHNFARVVNPDGTRGDFLRSNTGDPEGLQWGSLNSVGNALSVLRDDSLGNISRNLGGAHKVRNFYNNIISPDAGHDITIDTHAASAGLLRPLGSSAPEVSYALGSGVKKSARGPEGPDQWPTTPNSDPAGLKGIYPLYAEAYRRLADELGILPRQLQSVTWEGIRGLYSDIDRRNKPLIRANENLWRGVTDAQSAADARAAILARGIRPPNWHAGP